jgi:hypothetical protein
MIMKDPKEKNEPAEDQHKEPEQQQDEGTRDSNWDSHQRIDEEGNELDPDDIK